MEPDEYPRLAAAEDAMWYCRALRAHLRRELRNELHRALGPSSAATLLDAGCGTGGLLRELTACEPHWACTGVDAEPLACEHARARCLRANIELASVLHLPFANARFDAVVSSDVLYHLDDDHAALEEIRRVLKPGGVLVVNVPAHPWLWSYHDVAVHGRRRYTRADLTARLLRAGFLPTRSTHWNFLPLPLLIARRKLFPPRQPDHGSDVSLFPPPVECFFRSLMALEQGWLRLGGKFPAGSSLLVTARPVSRS